MIIRDTNRRHLLLEDGANQEAVRTRQWYVTPLSDNQYIKYEDTLSKISE